MEMKNQLPLWLILLTNCLITVSHSMPDDSILEIINKKEVERLLQQQKIQEAAASNRRYQITNNEPLINELPETLSMEKLQESSGNPRVDVAKFLRKNTNSSNVELLGDLRGYNGRKVLKSSKNALFITRKEYLQKDWCKTEPLIQKVKEDGCVTRTVINHFCYGQCNSFYIPKNPKKRQRITNSEEMDDEDQNGPAFRSCAFCKPQKFTWITIILKCPGLSPPYKKKRIQRIKQCKCTATNVD